MTAPAREQTTEQAPEAFDGISEIDIVELAIDMTIADREMGEMCPAIDVLGMDLAVGLPA